MYFYGSKSRHVMQSAKFLETTSLITLRNFNTFLTSWIDVTNQSVNECFCHRRTTVGPPSGHRRSKLIIGTFHKLFWESDGRGVKFRVS